MDNVKCHKRGWGWGGQEDNRSKPESSSSLSYMARKPANLASNLSPESKRLCELGRGFALSELMFPPGSKARHGLVCNRMVSLQ